MPLQVPCHRGRLCAIPEKPTSQEGKIRQHHADTTRNEDQNENSPMPLFTAGSPACLFAEHPPSGSEKGNHGPTFPFVREWEGGIYRCKTNQILAQLCSHVKAFTAVDVKLHS
jgi:hypothetical protein